ncbi:hypothetical protein JRQ81_017210 [Phrynocephalus forsythii]|uniref:Multiple inositol polyphosphate phosphatase 1 n=1 Tax=Phrynocephalus forsythii TaxID=171643 RepID=A0A9Q1B0A2_9SAUR|nr:hypothetical protein JRQ81_017210 [Phrynocephalus forsythii]
MLHRRGRHGPARAGALLLSLLLALAQGPAEGEAEAAEQLSPYFGTKSRYEELHPHLLEDPLSLGPPQPGFPLPPASCTPLQLSALVRHGTRYPTREQREKLGRLHALVLGRNNGTGSPCAAAERLSRWAMWLQPDMDGQLASRGRRDMKALAGRLAARFPGLLAPQRRLAFVSSSKPRCLDSAHAFREGLREALLQHHRGQQQQRPTAEGNETMIETFEINDRLMRFFDYCKKFIKDVEDNSTAMHEVNAFKKGPEMKKVLEYLNDLKQYWKRAYGYPIDSRSSCSLFQSIFKHLDQAVMESKSSKPISSPVILQFGHAETLQPLLALMGYFKDAEPLKAHNYHRQMDRKYRSGRIVPYAANLLFLLYRCDPEKDYKIQILLNERLLQFPHSGDTVSSYTSLENHYKDLLQNCNFDEVCAMPKNPSRTG